VLVPLEQASFPKPLAPAPEPLLAHVWQPVLDSNVGPSNLRRHRDAPRLDLLAHLAPELCILLGGPPVIKFVWVQDLGTSPSRFLSPLHLHPSHDQSPGGWDPKVSFQCILLKKSRAYSRLLLFRFLCERAYKRWKQPERIPEGEGVFNADLSRFHTQSTLPEPPTPPPAASPPSLPEYPLPVATLRQCRRHWSAFLVLMCFEASIQLIDLSLMPSAILPLT
jgi:hypothetical protein